MKLYLGTAVEPRRGWIRSKNTPVQLCHRHVATKSCDQEEGCEDFFGRRALEDLLQLGDLTVMRLEVFSLLVGLLLKPDPRSKYFSKFTLG